MKFKRASIVVIAIVLILIVFASVTLSSTREKIEQARADKEALQQQADALTQENAELEYQLEHSEDPALIEDIAREKLGLVKPGEKVFVDINN